MRQRLGATLTRSLGALVLAAALFEGTVRVAIGVGLLNLPVLGDARWPHVDLSALRRGSESPEKMWSATRGWANAPGVRTNAWRVGGPQRTTSINAIGARRTSEVTPTAAPGTLRVVAIGDSFTFGAEMDDGDVWLAQAERALPSTEIVNLGVSGYGQDQALLTLREVGVGLHPDVLLIGFVADDVERNLNDYHFARKPRFVLRDGALVLQASPVPSPEALRSLDRWRVHSLDVLALATGRWEAQDWSEATPLSVAILTRVVEEAAAVGARSLLVYLPATLPTAPDLDPGHTMPAYDEACLVTGLTCLDLRPALRDAKDSGLPMLEVTHWSPEVHALAAAALVELLRPQVPTDAPAADALTP